MLPNVVETLTICNLLCEIPKKRGKSVSYLYTDIGIYSNRTFDDAPHTSCRCIPPLIVCVLSGQPANFKSSDPATCVMSTVIPAAMSGVNIDLPLKGHRGT